MADRHNISCEMDGETYSGHYVVNRYIVNGGSPITTVTIYALGTQQTTQVGDFDPEAVAANLLKRIVETRQKA
jgi:hypothetical protein